MSFGLRSKIKIYFPKMFNNYAIILQKNLVFRKWCKFILLLCWNFFFKQTMLFYSRFYEYVPDWLLIVRKFNEEQLFLETFFPKMHIERDIHKKLIFKFIQSVKTPIKKSSRWRGGKLICCLGYHSRTFSALKLLPAHFYNIFPLILISFA